MTPDLDDLLSSPRALFENLNGLDYHRSRVLLDELAARGHGTHAAVVALAFGKDQVLSGQAMRLVAKQLEQPMHQEFVQHLPDLLALLVRTGAIVGGYTLPEAATANRAKALAMIDRALIAPRSVSEGLAIFPWLVALARSETSVAGPARLAAEEVLGGPLGDDAALVERLLGR